MLPPQSTVLSGTKNNGLETLAGVDNLSYHRTHHTFAVFSGFLILFLGEICDHWRSSVVINLDL